MSAAAELLDFYGKLAALRRDLPGATLLYTPDSPLIGGNAAYPTTPEGAARTEMWYRGQGAPAVLASETPVADAEEVLRLRVGWYEASAEPGSGVVVEQVSRRHLASVAGVLCAAWQVPEWSAQLARSLARSLEERADVDLWLAYAEEEVGALLALGGAAHVWGVLEDSALAPLLKAAATLNGGRVRTSLTAAESLPLSGESALSFWRTA